MSRLFPFLKRKNQEIQIIHVLVGQQFMRSWLTAYLPDTAIVAFTFIRIFEGRVAIGDLSRNTKFDTGFTSTCHSVRASGISFIAVELGRLGLMITKKLKVLAVLMGENLVPHCDWTDSFSQLPCTIINLCRTT